MGLFSCQVKVNWIGSGVSVGIWVSVAGGESVGEGEGEGGISVATTSVGVAVGSGGVVGSGSSVGGASVAALQATNNIPITRTKYLVSLSCLLRNEKRQIQFGGFDAAWLLYPPSM
jgi:hypothetical protein